ncbi:hypothetical protein BCR42DRAFT_407860 [Absidia repens]|uniref:Cysteine-rich transmembrane CYSTM domain-containing protein n=1 Tax=Absidia repens TaxID=90262 RepID=A0A1X2ISV8_9FUNG|nr:hypothetical protein BCR42DRAFT_407860 [Absidia repens]
MSQRTDPNAIAKTPPPSLPSPPVLDEKKTFPAHENSRLSSATTMEHRSPPPAYQPIFNHHHSLSSRSRSKHYVQPVASVYFYQPTPSPQTVIVHDTPSRSKDACCWGCVAGLILCFGAKECLCF